MDYEKLFELAKPYLKENDFGVPYQESSILLKKPLKFLKKWKS